MIFGRIIVRDRGILTEKVIISAEQIEWESLRWHSALRWGLWGWWGFQSPRWTSCTRRRATWCRRPSCSRGAWGWSAPWRRPRGWGRSGPCTHSIQARHKGEPESWSWSHREHWRGSPRGQPRKMHRGLKWVKVIHQVTLKFLLCLLTGSVVCEVLDHESLLVEGEHLAPGAVVKGLDVSELDLLGAGASREAQGHTHELSHRVCLYLCLSAKIVLKLSFHGFLTNYPLIEVLQCRYSNKHEQMYQTDWISLKFWLSTHFSLWSHWSPSINNYFMLWQTFRKSNCLIHSDTIKYSYQNNNV